MRARWAARIRQWRNTRLMARYLLHKQGEGYQLVPVPAWLAGEVRGLVWSKGVERAAENWAAAEADVSLTDWQSQTRPIVGGEE